jgi:hypothetical protein
MKRFRAQGTRPKVKEKKDLDLKHILKYLLAFKSPFEKGGNRGICFDTPCRNPPCPPLQKGGNTIYG